MMTTRFTLAGLRRAVTAAGTAVLGGIVLALVLSLITWAGASGGSPVEALRVGIAGWVYVHGASLSIAGATVTITPLGGSLLAVWLLAVAVARVRESDDDAWLAWGVTTIVLYTAAVVVVGVVVAGDVLILEDLAFITFAIATTGTTIGLRHAWMAELSARARTTVRAVTQAFVTLAVAGLLLVIAAVILQWDRFTQIWNSLDPGLAGGISLAVFCLAWIPNLAAWAIALMVGPGFALGVGTNVDLWGSQLGQVPAVPILAAVPPAGPFPGWVFALAAVPLLAGLVAGWRVADEVESERMSDVIAGGVVAGALAGLLIVGVAVASAGALGPGLMEQAGPSVWPLIVLAPVLLGFGGGLGAAAGHLRTSVATH